MKKNLTLLFFLFVLVSLFELPSAQAQTTTCPAPFLVIVNQCGFHSTFGWAPTGPVNSLITFKNPENAAGPVHYQINGTYPADAGNTYTGYFGTKIGLAGFPDVPAFNEICAPTLECLV